MTVFLADGERILLLRRSLAVGTFKGRWAGVSGFLEGEKPLERALIELREELGLLPSQVHLERIGEPLLVQDEEHSRDWLVHPFLFSVEKGVTLRLDWEHIDLRWVLPSEICGMYTVPGLFSAWERVR